MKKSPSANLSTFLLAQAGPLLTPVPTRLLSDFNNIIGASVLTISSSDVESLKHGIVKTLKNKANAPYTILLVGEIGVGKSSVLEFIANVLFGKDIDHYDLKIIDSTNERSKFGDQSQTESPRLYEFTSNSGVLVSSSIFERCEYM